MKNTLTSVAVRDAAQADAATIFAIRAKARASVYRDILTPRSWRSFEVQNAINPDTLGRWNGKVAEYLAQKDVYIFRVASIDGKVVGWSLSDIRKDQVHLMRLFVDPECHGNGVGSKLLNDLYELAGNKRITLTVLKPNLQAVNFYKKHGFIEAGDARYTYLSVPCLKMQKPVTHMDKIAI